MNSSTGKLPLLLTNPAVAVVEPHFPGGRPMSPQQHHLVKAVQKIIPEDKVAPVLPLMFKIMYLEAQLGGQ